MLAELADRRSMLSGFSESNLMEQKSARYPYSPLSWRHLRKQVFGFGKVRPEAIHGRQQDSPAALLK